MFMCPKYKKERESMTRSVKRLYMIHNIMNQNKNSNDKNGKKHTNSNNERINQLCQ